MAELGSIVRKVRSKNAGPFWLTIDIFCGTKDAYRQIAADLPDAAIARVFAMTAERVKRYECPELNVVKFSLPRPQIQGSMRDRDMHGAGWAALVAEIDMPE